MRRALHSVVPLTQSLRQQTCSRTTAISSRLPVAGPSSRRAYARTVEAEPTSSLPSTPVTSTSAPQSLGNSSSALPRVPPNVKFEGFEAGEGIAPQEDRAGFVLHRRPDPLGPFELPLSSLASSTPTRASETGEVIELPAGIFGKPLRRDILHRCVVWFLANLRQGSQSTKTRATVAYSGRKLRPQKGTGKARVGDASSGIRRGGAPIFPLHPRDHSQLLPRKIRQLGLYTALSSKLSSGLLRVVPSFAEAGWEGTNAARRALSNDVTWTAIEGDQEQLQVTERFGKPDGLSILFVRSGQDGVFERSLRNITGVEVMDLEDVQVYHVLKYKWCIMEREAVEVLSATDMGLERLDGDDLGEGALELESSTVA